MRAASGVPVPNPTTLTITLAAAATAAIAQALVDVHPWVSVGGFAAALGLSGLAARRGAAPTLEEPFPGERRRLPPRFLALLAAGTLFCLASGVAVYMRGSPLLTHPLWMFGLALFAGAALSAPRPVGGHMGRGGWRTLGALLLLVLACGFLFFWDLPSMPPEVHGDDAEVGLDAIHLMDQKPFNLFDTGWFGLPRFHAVPTAIGLKLFGNNLTGLRVTSAALGLGTVLLVFAVARRLWGFDVALISALLLCSQRFFIHLSRAGYHYVDAPFLSVLVVWLFLRAWQDRRVNAALWCGIALGLGIQTYFASRLVPLLFCATWFLWMLAEEEEERPSRLASFAVTTLVAVATAAPMLAHFAHDQGSLWGRFLETSIFTEDAFKHVANGHGTNSLWRILCIQTEAALTLFNRTGDTSLQYGYNAPLLEPLGAVLFVLGLGTVVARARRRPNVLLLLWTGLPLLAGAALTVDAPFYPRISGLLPFVAILMALGANQVLTALRTGLPARVAPWVAAAASAAMLLIVFANNIDSYFFDYAPNHRLSPIVEISDWVRENGSQKTTYLYSGPRNLSVHHGAMSFLARGFETRDLQVPGRDLKGADPERNLFVVLPEAYPSLSKLTDATGPLDVTSHRDHQGRISFYTAVPAAARARPKRGQSILPRRVGVLANLPRAVDGARNTGLVALLAALTFAGVLAVLRRRRSSHTRGSVSRARDVVDSVLSRLFGPDEREHSGDPPASLAWSLLAAITLLAIVLRVYELANLPPGFFCDEAGLGYNAYSILHSGRDETGAYLPLYVWSFNVSYKNPVFIYSAMLPMAILGPSELAVRLTSAFYGVASVVAMFFLGRALRGAWLGILAALFLAVCPWHLHFSRIAFELITFPFFFILGLTSLVRYTQGRRTLAQAMVLFGICLYTYAPAKLFVPLFVVGFTLLYHRMLLRRWKESLLAVVLLASITAPLVIFDLRYAGRSTSYLRATSSLADDQSIAEAAGHLGRNYVSFFSHDFLFERGDRITRHAVRGHGELYLFFLPLLPLGVLAAIGRRDRSSLLPLWWLALYPLAPALMNEIPSASRGFIGAPAFCLVAAMGGSLLLRLPTQFVRSRRLLLAVEIVAFGLGCVALAPQVQGYWNLYSREYPRYAAKYYSGFQFGHRQVVEYFLEHYEDYDRLVLTPYLNNQPEMLLSFYSALHDRPAAGAAPFRYGDKMQVVSPEELNLYRDGRPLLLAARPEELLLFDEYDVREEVTAPDGSAAFVLAEVRKPKDFVYSWRVVGPYDKAYTPPAPEFDPKTPPRLDPSGKAWRSLADPSARVRIHNLFGFEERTLCAWAVNFLTSEERDISVHAGFDDDGQVWINGEEVPLRRSETAGDTLIDKMVGQTRLRDGRNTVAVRTCNVRDEWFFYFRVTARDGQPLKDATWEYDAIGNRPKGTRHQAATAPGRDLIDKGKPPR